MWVPEKLYEALPAIYVTTGIAITACAFYIGVGNSLMIGYLMLGSGCAMAGIFVKSMRNAARSRKSRVEA